MRTKLSKLWLIAVSILASMQLFQAMTGFLGGMEIFILPPLLILVTYAAVGYIIERALMKYGVVLTLDKLPRSAAYIMVSSRFGTNTKGNDAIVCLVNRLDPDGHRQHYLIPKERNLKIPDSVSTHLDIDSNGTITFLPSL